MAVSFLQVENLCKSFGDLFLFKDISFGISEGQRVGLIAPNGSGKTTLLNILAGDEPYDSGSVTYKRDLKVAYLKQEPSFRSGQTVLEACFSAGSEITDLIARYEKAVAMGSHEGMDELLQRMDSLQAWDYEFKVKQILGQLKITDFEQKVESLSGGQLKRVALANVLITEPDLIILDEPTNHLDLDMVAWLEEHLRKSRLSLLMVTHDRYFLDNVCNEILEIDQQSLFHYKGNYSYYLEKREERMSAQIAEKDRANNLFRRELDWIRRQPQARGGKAKYRIDAFEELEKKVKQTSADASVSIEVKSSYIGNKIFEAEHVFKSFGDKKILEDFNYVFSRYEKLGIIGNNGTGKSTFIKLLLGLVDPDKGHFDVGETVKFGYYSQDGLKFDDQKKVIDVISEIAEVIDLGNGRRLTASQFLQHFLFPPEKQHNYVYKLSGGERRRLYLCSVLISNPNFLVLDEPTNDLDIITLNVLEDYLTSFKGCVIVVSHDRFFMDKVVDHLLVFNGNANIKDFPGNYTRYREWKAEQDRLAAEEEKAVKIVKAESAVSSRKTESVSKKLSFKEKQEFETLDKTIPELEELKAKLESELSSGSLSNEELLTKSNQISALIEDLDEKSMRWLELGERI